MDDGTASTIYAYGTDGVRASEVSSTQSTYFLNDTENPTGYTKAIEEKSSPTATPTRSYILGLKVEGQSDAGSTEYLLTDGHGSTRELIDLSGTAGASLDYDAFGAALDFDAAAAGTPWLYGGDGLYDPATGWTYHLARWRDGFRFTSMDTYPGDGQSPITLHRYLYGNDDPVQGVDPNGSMTLIDVVVAAQNVVNQIAQRVPIVGRATVFLVQMISAFTIYTLFTDPQAGQDMAVFAAAGGDNPGAMLAADFRTLASMSRTTQSLGRKIVTLRLPRGADVQDFLQKARRLQNAASEGRLVRVSGSAYDRLREEASALQNAYRKAVQKRFTRMLVSKGVDEEHAAATVKQFMDSRQADHRIDLQVSGALANPNSNRNLKMLDSTTNQGIGSQLKLEMNRLGIRNGDTIDGVIIVH
jgi:hypothetical protein